MEKFAHSGGFLGGLKKCWGCPNFAKEKLPSLNHFHFHPDMIQRKPMLSLRKGKYSLPDHFSISNAETARCNIYWKRINETPTLIVLSKFFLGGIFTSFSSFEQKIVLRNIHSGDKSGSKGVNYWGSGEFTADVQISAECKYEEASSIDAPRRRCIEY